MKKYLVVFLLASSAHAETVTSLYSDLDIKKCKIIAEYKEDVGGIELRCKGIKGYDVWYTEGDLRGSVSFGPEAKKQCSALQTFGAFNSVGNKVEWRMAGGKPFATILRWFTDNGEAGGKQNWLVVTKLNGNDACRTALIDTKYPNANAVAQQKADSSASFNCEKDSVVVVGSSKKGDETVSPSPCGSGPYGQ
jgi:hypothetical protein